MPDTFFTASPEWSLFIVPYFFVGGIAGGSYFLAALLHWLGRPEDEHVVRLGYVAAFVGALLSALLLVVDLGQPLRFWHMLFQSERFPLPVLKAWSPMSAGAWALFFFGMFATMSAAGALAVSGRMRWSWPRVFYQGLPGRIIGAIGALFGVFIAGYTGVLLSVTNRPIWADTHWLGVLFLISAASTAAATLILLARRRGSSLPVDPTVEWLVWFDGRVLILELIVLAVFLFSLGGVATVWLSWRGLLLFLFVILLGIIVPLAFHFRPMWFRDRWRSRRIATGAWLVLLGGFFLRFITLLASETLHAPRSGLRSAGLWP